MIGAPASATVLLQGAQLLLEGCVLLAQGVSLGLPGHSCPLKPLCLTGSILQCMQTGASHQRLLCG